MTTTKNEVLWVITWKLLFSWVWTFDEGEIKIWTGESFSWWEKLVNFWLVEELRPIPLVYGKPCAMALPIILLKNNSIKRELNKASKFDR